MSDYPNDYLKSAEMAVENNLNQIDGIINNVSPRRADLTDGQTWDEIQELAPDTTPDEKPSILAQLAENKTEIKPPTCRDEQVTETSGFDR